MKKILAVALALLMALSVLPMPAMAADAEVLRVTTGEDAVDEADGVVSLREALAAADPGDTVTVDDSVGTISLTSALTVDKKVTLQLSGQTIVSGYDPGSVLAAIQVGEHGELTLSGRGTVKAAELKTSDPNKKADSFALYLANKGALAIGGEVGVSGDAGETVYLIGLNSETRLTLNTQGRITGGGVGIKALNGATAYSVTIHNVTEISSGIAMSLLDGPSASIENAALTGGLIAEVPLRNLVAPGYEVLLDGTPATEDQLNALPVKEMANNLVFRYYVAPEPVATTYTVTYMDGETVLNTASVEEGQPAPEYTPAEKEGFTFTGWDPALPTEVHDNITVYAQWTENPPVPATYTVTYMDGETVLNTASVEEGQPAPEYTPAEKEGFTFAGWDPALPAAVYDNVTVYAQWTKNPVYYTVTYTDPDGHILTSEDVLEGQAPSVFIPSLEGFDFIGWDPELPAAIYESITVKAIFQEKPPVLYTVTYQDGDEDVLFVETVAEGQPAPAHTAEKVGYNFMGWNPAPPEAVHENMTLNALWQIKTFTVEYTDGQGSVLSTQKVDFGHNAEPYTGTPSRDGYTFKGWDKELPSPITENVTINAVWEEIPAVVNYTLTFDAAGGKPVNPITVEAGKSVNLPSATRDGYTFKGWADSANNRYAAGDAYLCNADMTFTAQWEIIPVTPTLYTVTYTDGQGHNLDIQTVEAGQAAQAYTGTPVREGYTFSGWDKELPAAINADITINAQWTIKTYTVRYVDGQGNTVSTQTVEHGKAAQAYTGTPTRPGFAFKGWDRELPAAITADVTITALWEAEKPVEPTMYTVTYTDGQGHTLDIQTVESGKAAKAYSGKPAREGYTFTGWDKELPAAITSDVTITAQWKINTYTVRYVDGQGNTLDTQTVEYGKAAKAYTGTPTRAGFTFKGWDKELPAAITSDVTITAVWEGNLPVVSSLLWDGTKAVWGGVNGADRYSVQLYRNDQALGGAVTASGTSYDFASSLTQDGSYTYKVKPMAGSAEGDWSKASAVKTVDLTAPSISSQRAPVRTNEKEAVFYFTSSEAGKYNYMIVNAGDGAPTAAQVAASSAGGSCTNAETSVALKNLSDSKARDVYIVVTDASGNRSGVFKISIPEAAPAALYTVTFDVAGGDPLTAVKVEAGQLAILPKPTRTGYTFKGWKGPDGKIHDANTSVTVNGDMTFVAQWEVAAPTTFNVTLPTGNGFTVSPYNNSKSPVEAGGSYSFTVSIANGYVKGSGYAVKTNGVTLAAYNNVYTITNITADQTVTVSGVVWNQGGGGGGSTLPTAPSITTTLLPSATMGQEYKQQLTATGAAPITWTYTGTMPEGITLNTQTGLISGIPAAEGSFRIAVKASNAGGTVTRQMTLVVVGSEYTITQGSNAEWSQGSSEGLTFQGSGSTDFTVRIDGSAVPADKLSTSADGKSVTVAPEYLETLSTGSHTLTMVYKDGNAKARFNIKAQDRTVPPTITAQPLSSEANEGTAVTFTVTASGTTPLLCQWQVDKQDGKGWTDIVGAASASYTVDAVTAEQNGWQYRCVITNAAGKAESNGATLTVKEAIGDVTADDTQTPTRGGAGKVILFSALGLVVVALATGGVIFYRRRKDEDYDDEDEDDPDA